MKNKILTASAVMVAAAMSFGLELWSGDQGEYKITTGFGDGTDSDESGYWYSYADNADGGLSAVTWPVGLGNDYSTDALDPVIDECKGVCGDFTLSAGPITYKPFVGIGFNLVSGAQEPADASSWGGLCIGYSASIAPALELGLGDAKDSELGYDNPLKKLTKSTTGTVTNIAWSDFKQEGWGSGKITGPEAAATLAAVKFKLQGADGTTGKFNIMSIGKFTDKCVTTDGSAPSAPGAAIGDKAMQASLKAQLSGRTLSFGKTVAKAELVNLQGQVVMAASSVSAMDLSKLQAGVYMVRTMGLSQQILLK